MQYAMYSLLQASARAASTAFLSRLTPSANDRSSGGAPLTPSSQPSNRPCSRSRTIPAKSRASRYAVATSGQASWSTSRYRRSGSESSSSRRTSSHESRPGPGGRAARCGGEIDGSGSG